MASLLSPNRSRQLEERAVVITGGHNPGHSRDVSILHKLLKSLIAIECADLSAIHHGLLDQFRILLIFTSLESASSDILNCLIRFANKESRLLVFLHEAAIYDRSNSDFRRILPVRFNRHYEYSRFQVFVKEHVLTKGVPNSFYITDECYFFDEPMLLTESDDVFLLNAENKPLAFKRVLSDSGTSVIYVGLGHDVKSLENVNFQRILKNIFTFSKQSKWVSWD